jgi:hypothetical protein
VPIARTRPGALMTIAALTPEVALAYLKRLIKVLD